MSDDKTISNEEHELIENIKAFGVDMIRKEIRGIVGDLEVMSRARRSLREDIFTGVYLPLFYNKGYNPYGVDIEHWVIHVSGSPDVEVDIIDNRGEVIYTIPPIIDRSACTYINGETSYYEALKTSDLQGMQSKIRKEVYLNSYLKDKVISKVADEKVQKNMIKNIETWNSIFTRYGLEPLFNLEEVVPDELKKAKETNIEEDEDYCEWVRA